MTTESFENRWPVTGAHSKLNEFALVYVHLPEDYFRNTRNDWFCRFQRGAAQLRRQLSANIRDEHINKNMKIAITIEKKLNTLNLSIYTYF